jgi:hypothetical protein
MFFFLRGLAVFYVQMLPTAYGSFKYFVWQYF